MQGRWPRIVSGRIVRKAEKWAGSRRDHFGGPGGRLRDGFGRCVAAQQLAQVELKLGCADFNGAFASVSALDEPELGIRELTAAGGQRFQAELVGKTGRDQAAVVEAELAAVGQFGQLETARVVQLADELDNCRQPDPAERTLQLNHMFDLDGASLRRISSDRRNAQE
jgi:hypothetical protein